MNEKEAVRPRRSGGIRIVFPFNKMNPSERFMETETLCLTFWIVQGWRLFIRDPFD
jgi:hypothetical protein